MRGYQEAEDWLALLWVAWLVWMIWPSKKDKP